MGDEELGETLHLKILGRTQKTYGTCGTMPSWNNSLISPTHGGFRQWEGHAVKNSETMVGIALKYDITVEDIRRCNNLWTNDSLWPGQVLRIPVKSPTNFLSPPMVSPNYDENNSHSKQLNTPTSISTNDKNFDLAGLSINNSSTSSLTPYNSNTSTNLPSAPHKSSRRNTKSSMSSNQNSSSSDIADCFDEYPRSSHGGSFSQLKKGSSFSNQNTLENSTSEVTASEFLSRMDMSIEATRKNMNKSSPNNTIGENNIPNSATNDPLAACTSESVGKRDKNRIIC